MVSSHPLFDPPHPNGAVPGPGDSPPESSPHLLAGVLRRWPWLLLGLLLGLIVGTLYHVQRRPVYQSTAQLMVLKNRPELVAGGAGDVRVQFVEDYVAGQVILLRSERILKRAAEKHLPRHNFEMPPPESVPQRVGFLASNFQITREKEPGSNVGSNVLALSFKAPHPLDAPKYLQAIIAAYRDELAEVFEDASTRQLRQLDEEIAAVERAIRDLLAQRAETEQQLLKEDPVTGRLRVPEDLSVIRNRIMVNRKSESDLKLRRIEIDAELEDVQRAGSSRPVRLAVMARLGIPPERSNLLNPDVRSDEGLLRHLKYRRGELAARYGYGPGHPEIAALDRQIEELEREIAVRGPGGDELDWHRHRLLNERATIDKKLKILEADIAEDEKKLLELTPIHTAIQKATDNIAREELRLKELLQLRGQIRRTERGGVFEVKEVTTPGVGVQVAPVLLQSLALGMILGLLLGGGTALGMEMADRSFRSPADIRRHLGVPVLGHVPWISDEEPAEIEPQTPLDGLLVTYLRPRSPEAEAFRAIRNQLLFATTERNHQIIQVTSPHPGDGKSTLSGNLAISLALAGKRVILVDGDFRKPRVHRLFARPAPPVGLATVIDGQTDLAAAVHRCEIDNLFLLPCGPRPGNPAELLTRPRFQEILNELRAAYDYVLVDTPPVLAVSDPSAVAPRVDGIILVFRMTRDAKPTVERAKNDLLAVGGRIFGVVVNAARDRDAGYSYGYSYRYNYRYSYAYRYADSETDGNS